MASNLPFGFEEEDPLESPDFEEPDDDFDDHFLDTERPYTEPEE